MGPRSRLMARLQGGSSHQPILQFFAVPKSRTERATVFINKNLRKELLTFKLRQPVLHCSVNLFFQILFSNDPELGQIVNYVPKIIRGNC